MPRTNAQAVILEILRQTDGEWVGRTKLFKAFYFAHLYYANERPELLTDWPIARMPHGPGIHNSEVLFRELMAAGLLAIEREHMGPYPEYRYRLTREGQAAVAPPEDAVRAIHDAVGFCKDKTATELSAITHERSRSWNQASNGELLNIEIDLIPEDEYERREKDLDQTQEIFGRLFEENPA